MISLTGISRSGIGILLSGLLLPLSGFWAPATGQDEIHQYGQRMEAMFVRMDVNGDGRLVPAEVRGKPFLERRLRRPNSRGFLLIEDLHTRSPHHSGPRLQQHFTRADRNADGYLNRQESRALPWVHRHFTGLDLNGDGQITLAELWSLQKALAPRMRP
tara:strand:+ start:868 stop:1344 length:477 start_codon:yes stop_codon:yes gene_type:complete